MKVARVVAIAMLSVALSPADPAPATERLEWHSDPNTFAAIAYSPSTGKYGYSYNYRSRVAAEKTALNNLPVADARIVGWVKAGICALALGDDKTSWGVGWSYGNGARTEDAKEAALAECSKQTTHPYIALYLLSDGQFIWKSPEISVPPAPWQSSWDAFVTLVEQELNRLPPDATGPWEGKEVSWQGTVRQIERFADKNLIMLGLEMPRRTLSIKNRDVIAQRVIMFVPMTREQEQGWALKEGDRIRFKTTLARNRTLTLQDSDAHGAVSVVTVSGQGSLLVFTKGGTISK